MDAELVLDAKATLGEGALWDARYGRLLWVDIEENKVHLLDPDSGSDEAIDVGQMVGTVVPRAKGGLMLALHHGLASLDLSTRKLQIIADPESSTPENRFNDGKCDPAGRFWAGTISLKRIPGAASLWCLDTDLSVRRMLGGVTNSNGITWSLDGTTLYYIDTPTRRIDALDYRIDTGEIGNRRTIVMVPDELGKPDGMTIDAEGMLWTALWGGSRVARWDPRSGRLLQTVEVPAARTSSCAFGGSGLRELYITTARTGATQEELLREPHAGGIFVARPGAAGRPAFEFAG